MAFTGGSQSHEAYMTRITLLHFARANCQSHMGAVRQTYIQMYACRPRLRTSVTLLPTLISSGLTAGLSEGAPLAPP